MFKISKFVFGLNKGYPISIKQIPNSASGCINEVSLSFFEWPELQNFLRISKALNQVK